MNCFRSPLDCGERLAPCVFVRSPFGSPPSGTRATDLPFEPACHTEQLCMSVRQVSTGQAARLVENVQDPIEDRQPGASPAALTVENRLSRLSPMRAEHDRSDDRMRSGGRVQVVRRRGSKVLGRMLGREGSRKTRSAETREHNDLLSPVGIAVGYHAENSSIVDLRTQAQIQETGLASRRRANRPTATSRSRAIERSSPRQDDLELLALRIDSLRSGCRSRSGVFRVGHRRD